MTKPKGKSKATVKTDQGNHPVWVVYSFSHGVFVKFHGIDLWRYPLPRDFKLRQGDYELVQDVHNATEIDCNRLADDLVKALHRLKLPQCFDIKSL